MENGKKTKTQLSNFLKYVLIALPDHEDAETVAELQWSSTWADWKFIQHFIVI